MGFNGIQGSTMVTCLGTAFNSVYTGTDDVTVVFLGDGTLGEGTCHESMYMAATWKLPVIYVLINNYYAILSHYTEAHPQPQLAQWADGYCVPNSTIDGNNIEDVIETTQEAIDRARKGEGPTLIEMMTYRWQGHFSGDPAAYRPDGELEDWMEKDPIKISREKLQSAHGVSDKEIEDIQARVEKEIEEHVKFSLESPVPKTEDAVKYVYTDREVEGR